MNNAVYFLIVAILLLVGLGLLFLTNSGLLSFGKPYIIRKSPELRPDTTGVAFTNVNVVPMDREHILEDQTVIVRNGIIEEIGDSGEVDAPGDALIVEGAGRYLMPGLIDMHVHVEEENELLVLVAHGVTTARNMWGHMSTERTRWLGAPDQLALREQINQGQLFGPTIYTTGPVMEGEPPTSPFMPVFTTPEEAQNSVAWQSEQGYDFVKVYDNLATETYRAILGAAREHGLPVVGHVPKKVGLDAVLEGEQASIEHLTGYIDPDAADFIIPEDQLQRYAQITREAGVWNCPTIGLYQKTVPAEEIERLERQPGMEYVSPRTQLLWRLFSMRMSEGLTYKGTDYPARIAEIYTQMTKALHDAGAKIILGTDSSNPYHILGFSLHEELGHLVNAGLTPYEAIRAGTRDAAEGLGKLDEFGTVAVGKRADLILVEENPLEDMTNADKRVGVMLRGYWLSEAQLSEMLNELAASYAPPVVERAWPLGLIALGLFLILRRLF